MPTQIRLISSWPSSGSPGRFLSGFLKTLSTRSGMTPLYDAPSHPNKMDVAPTPSPDNESLKKRPRARKWKSRTSLALDKTGSRIFTVEGHFVKRCTSGLNGSFSNFGPCYAFLSLFVCFCPISLVCYFATPGCLLFFWSAHKQEYKTVAYFVPAKSSSGNKPGLTRRCSFRLPKNI